MKKELVKSMLTSIADNMGENSAVNRTGIANMVISHESGTQQVIEASANFDDQLQHALQTLSHESADFAGVEFPAHCVAAAKTAAAMALSPESAYIGNRNLHDARVAPGATVVGTIGSESMTLDNINDSVLGVEAFDGQRADNAVYMSFVFNLFASKQSKFAETFFPTVVMDPAASGIAVEAVVASMQDEFLRSKTGSTDRSKFNRQSIAKKLRDGNVLSVPRNKLVPVSRVGENDAVLNNSITWTDDSRGEEITTAPIKTGVAVSLLGVSQTDDDLAKSVRDNTDALDRHAKLTKLFFDLTEGGGPTTETFVANVEGKPHMNFTYSTQGHNKDMLLSYAGEAIVINTTNTTQQDGTTSTVLGTLAANHTIKLKVVLSGTGNTQDGDIAVYSNSVEIAEIRDGSGALITSGAVFDAIKAITDTIDIHSYTIDAYATNSNLRNRPQVIGVDVYSQIYTVPVRTGTAILKSAVGNTYDTDDDANRLGTQISLTGIQMDQDAVATLVDYADMLNATTQGGTVTEGLEFEGMASNFVDPYYSAVAFDAADYVDSQSSKDRTLDIGSAITAKIRDEITKMASTSNYNAAHELLFGNTDMTKIGVVVGCGSRIGEYINAAGLELGDGYDVQVVTNHNTLIGSNIYITFVDLSSTKNQKPSPLGFGFTAYSPELSADVLVSRSGTTRELVTMPRYRHVAQLPVMATIAVSNIESVLAKVTQNHTVI